MPLEDGSPWPRWTASGCNSADGSEQEVSRAHLKQCLLEVQALQAEVASLRSAMNAL